MISDIWKNNIFGYGEIWGLSYVPKDTNPVSQLRCVFFQRSRVLSSPCCQDLTTIDFSDILPNTAVMAITVTASMTAGTQLPRLKHRGQRVMWRSWMGHDGTSFFNSLNSRFHGTLFSLSQGVQCNPFYILSDQCAKCATERSFRWCSFPALCGSRLQHRQ